jgi:hypothetical protein
MLWRVSQVKIYTVSTILIIYIYIYNIQYIQYIQYLSPPMVKGAGVCVCPPRAVSLAISRANNRSGTPENYRGLDLQQTRSSFSTEKYEPFSPVTGCRSRTVTGDRNSAITRDSDHLNINFTEVWFTAEFKGLSLTNTWSPGLKG